MADPIICSQSYICYKKVLSHYSCILLLFNSKWKTDVESDLLMQLTPSENKNENFNDINAMKSPLSQMSPNNIINDVKIENMKFIEKGKIILYTIKKDKEECVKNENFNINVNEKNLINLEKERISNVEDENKKNIDIEKDIKNKNLGNEKDLVKVKKDIGIEKKNKNIQENLENEIKDVGKDFKLEANDNQVIYENLKNVNKNIEENLENKNNDIEREEENNNKDFEQDLKKDIKDTKDFEQDLNKDEEENNNKDNEQDIKNENKDIIIDLELENKEEKYIDIEKWKNIEKDDNKNLEKENKNIVKEDIEKKIDVENKDIEEKIEIENNDFDFQFNDFKIEKLEEDEDDDEGKNEEKNNEKEEQEAKKEIFLKEVENIFISKISVGNTEKKSEFGEKSSDVQNLSFQDIGIMEEKFFKEKPPRLPVARHKTTANIIKSEEKINIKKRVSLKDIDSSFEIPPIEEDSKFFEDIPINILEESLKKKNFKNVSAMQEINVFKIFDALLIEKKKEDQLYVLNNKTKKNMNEFCLIYFYRTYGVKELLYRNLYGFKTTVQNLYKNNDPYGVLMARMLGICESKTVDDQISDLLIDISHVFEFVKNQWNKEEAKLHENAEKIKKKKIDEKTKHLEAPLLDIYELTLKIFEKDQENCLEVINNLLPKNVRYSDKNEKIIFFDKILLLILNYKFAKIGKNIKEIFEQCDTSGDGKLDYDEFSEGILNKYQIKLHPEQKKRLFTLLDINNKGSINIQEWSKLINLHDYKKQYHLTTIVKLDYLISILDVLEKKMELKRLENLEIFTSIQKKNENLLSIDEFLLFAEKYNKVLKKEDLISIFEKGINYQKKCGILEDGLNFETFFRIVTKEKFENIGEYLKFNENTIIENMQAKKIRFAKKHLTKI